MCHRVIPSSALRQGNDGVAAAVATTLLAVTTVSLLLFMKFSKNKELAINSNFNRRKRLRTPVFLLRWGGGGGVFVEWVLCLLSFVRVESYFRASKGHQPSYQGRRGKTKGRFPPDPCRSFRVARAAAARGGSGCSGFL